MIEVEIKLKIEDKNIVKNKLLSLGFTESDILTETDTYFDNNTQDIRNNDSALRIRETVNHTKSTHYCQINFKGKKLDSKTMSRPEYETVVDDSISITGILNGLGFYSVEPKVIKKRIELKSSDMNACIDTVEGLGDFLELESVIEDSGSKDIELKKIEKILTELGYRIEDTMTVSYLSQLQNML